MRKSILTFSAILIILVVVTPPVAAEPLADTGLWHTVSYGETLYSIGRWYGVNPYTICRANNLWNCSRIFAGQKLWIPTGYTSSYSTTSTECRSYHTVSRGETLYGIARRYGARVHSIIAANNIRNPNLIHRGNHFCIPYEGSTIATVPAAPPQSVPPTSSQMKRIQFPTGGTWEQENSSIAPNQTQTYVLRANAGQTMSVHLLNCVWCTIGIRGADGAVLLSNYDGAITWEGQLPSTQDYYIDVVSFMSEGHANFTLQVAIW